MLLAYTMLVGYALQFALKRLPHAGLKYGVFFLPKSNVLASEATASGYRDTTKKNQIFAFFRV